MSDRPQPGSRYPSRPIFADESSRAYAGGAASPRRTLGIAPIALGVIAGVALVIIGAALLSQRPAAAQPPSFTTTARQVCNDLTTQQYDDLYGLLSPAQQQIGPREQFVAAQRQLDAQLGAAHSCVYSAAQQDAHHVALTLTLTRGSSPTATAQAQLTYEQQGWRISDYDTALVEAPNQRLNAG